MLLFTKDCSVYKRLYKDARSTKHKIGINLLEWSTVAVKCMMFNSLSLILPTLSCKMINVLELIKINPQKLSKIVHLVETLTLCRKIIPGTSNVSLCKPHQITDRLLMVSCLSCELLIWMFHIHSALPLYYIETHSRKCDLEILNMAWFEKKKWFQTA